MESTIRSIVQQVRIPIRRHLTSASAAVIQPIPRSGVSGSVQLDDFAENGHPVSDALATNIYMKDTNSKKQGLNSPGVYCMQFDLSCFAKDNKSKLMDDFKGRIKTEVKIMKPELVFLQNASSEHFGFVLTKMKSLGYDGYFNHEVDGKGQATFYRMNP